MRHANGKLWQMSPGPSLSEHNCSQITWSALDSAPYRNHPSMYARMLSKTTHLPDSSISFEKEGFKSKMATFAAAIYIYIFRSLQSKIIQGTKRLLGHSLIVNCSMKLPTFNIQYILKKSQNLSFHIQEKSFCLSGL